MKAPKRNLSIAEIIQLGESGGLLTQSQIGAVMQMSNSTVSRMVNSNQIPYVLIRAGRRKKDVRFRWREIEQWLTIRSRGPKGRQQRNQIAENLDGNQPNTLNPRAVGSLQ